LTEQVDANAVRSGVDMAYKLKKRYENPDQTVIIKKFDEMTDEELEKSVNDLLNKAGKPITT
jgi:hypothetical protein